MNSFKVFVPPLCCQEDNNKDLRHIYQKNKLISLI